MLGKKPELSQYLYIMDHFKSVPIDWIRSANMRFKKLAESLASDGRGARSPSWKRDRRILYHRTYKDVSRSRKKEGAMDPTSATSRMNVAEKKEKLQSSISGLMEIGGGRMHLQRSFNCEKYAQAFREGFEST